MSSKVIRRGESTIRYFSKIAQFVLQNPSSPRDPRFYGSDTNLENLRDFGVTIAFDIAQNDRLTIRVGKFPQFPEHRDLPFTRDGELFRIAAAVCYSIRLNRVAVAQGRVEGNGPVEHPAFPPTKAIPGMIHGYPKKPGLQFCVAAKVIDPPNSTQERFLHDIVGVLAALCQTKREAENITGKPLNEHVEGFRFPGLQAFDKTYDRILDVDR